MTSFDFYVAADDRIAVACRLAAKAVQTKKRMVVYAPDGNVLARLNQQLWTTPPTGFVPHCLATDRHAAETPVILARTLDGKPADEVLVNLSDDTPPAFERYERVIEIVSEDDEDKARARARFRRYREHGYEIRTHNLARAE